MTSHAAYRHRTSDGRLRRWRVRKHHRHPYDYRVDLWCGDEWRQVAGGYKYVHWARWEALRFHGPEFEEGAP